MILETLVVGTLEVNCYILGCERTRQAVVIDPGDDARAIQAVLRRHNLTLVAILATHAHFDHLLAGRPLQQATGAAFYLHPAERSMLEVMPRMTMAWLGYDPGEPPTVDGDLLPGRPVVFGDETLEVRFTPGHSPGGVTLVHHAGRRAFTGDALFAGGIGRTDLPGGHAATLLASIRAQILSLPADYVVLPGHGPATTVGEEALTNPFLLESDLWRGLQAAGGQAEVHTTERAEAHTTGQVEAHTAGSDTGADAWPEEFCLPAELRDAILAHARAGYPEEVCGIIAGKNSVAVALYRGRNVSPTPRVAYELDTETLLRQIEFEATGLTLAAIYHSHPAGPPIPSASDIARATYPDSIYLICSLADPARPTLRGFRIVAGRVTEVRLT